MDEYYNWLCNLVGPDYYSNLFALLYQHLFCSDMELDRGRAEEGIDLRYIFKEKTNGQYKTPKGPCKFLEMMVALAIRCENQIMQDDRYPDRTKDWFHAMIENLGLSEATDSNWSYRWQKYADEQIRRVNDRDYRHTKKRNGCLWPLDHDDPSKYDIWIQMNKWLVENEYV